MALNMYLDTERCMKTPFLLILMPLLLLSVECHAAPADPDVDWRSYQETICLKVFGGEIVLPALGHGHVCGHPTPNCNQAYCGACASKLGVCEVCGKKNTWTRNTDPAIEVPLLLAMLKFSDNLEARRIAIFALGQIRAPKTLDRMMAYSQDPMLAMQLSMAIGEAKDARYIDYLQMVLHSAGNDYFGDGDGDTEKQYYIAQSAQTAAQSLAAIGNAKAVKVLLLAARKGRLWERCYALGALGMIDSDDSRAVLLACLNEFFAKNSDWKWIPGRDLIGAALKSLSQIGDRAAALQVIGHIKVPGCDFLYTDLEQCLSQIGRPVTAEIMTAVREGLSKGPMDYPTRILLETLGNIADPEAIPFFIELLNADYPDDYAEGDIKGLALQGLAKVRAVEAIDVIAHELNNGRDESTRQYAAQALERIGGLRVFDILTEKVKQGDSDWVIRECFAGLVTIAFEQLKDDGRKLAIAKLYVQRDNYEYAFDILYQSVTNAETWGTEYFFQILPKVPMPRKIYQVIELLGTGDRQVFEKTLLFLKKYTKQVISVRFDDPGEKKTAARNALYSWCNEHPENLK